MFDSKKEGLLRKVGNKARSVLNWTKDKVTKVLSWVTKKTPKFVKKPVLGAARVLSWIGRAALAVLNFVVNTIIVVLSLAVTLVMILAAVLVGLVTLVLHKVTDALRYASHWLSWVVSERDLTFKAFHVNAEVDRMGYWDDKFNEVFDRLSEWAEEETKTNLADRFKDVNLEDWGWHPGPLFEEDLPYPVRVRVYETVFPKEDTTSQEFSDKYLYSHVCRDEEELDAFLEAMEDQGLYTFEVNPVEPTESVPLTETMFSETADELVDVLVKAGVVTDAAEEDEYDVDDYSPAHGVRPLTNEALSALHRQFLGDYIEETVNGRRVVDGPSVDDYDEAEDWDNTHNWQPEPKNSYGVEAPVEDPDPEPVSLDMSLFPDLENPRTHDWAQYGPYPEVADAYEALATLANEREERYEFSYWSARAWARRNGPKYGWSFNKMTALLWNKVNKRTNVQKAIREGVQHEVDLAFSLTATLNKNPDNISLSEN